MSCLSTFFKGVVLYFLIGMSSSAAILLFVTNQIKHYFISEYNRQFSQLSHRLERGGKHPAEHRTPTKSQIDIIIPSTDHHVSELPSE